jgi:cytochrome b561/polyisoprenoid-binding protein YceI
LQLTNTIQRYGALSRLLHWLIAGGIVLQFVLAKLAELADADEARLKQLAVLANHKSVGITILSLALVRLLWRLISTPPPLPASMSSVQRRVSYVSHWLLYVLLFVMPLSGWLMSSASAYSVSWFNLFTLPDLVAPNSDLKDLMLLLHHWLASGLFTLAVLHVAAALKHHFLDKDDVMRRMSSVTAWLGFTMVIGVGVITLAGRPDSQTTTTLPAAADATHDDADATKHHDDDTAPFHDDVDGFAPKPTPWQIDYANSHIRFRAEQAGAEFTGTWQHWSAEIHFASDSLANSAIIVSVEVAGIETRDADRDATLLDPEWFDQIRYPVVTFSTQAFRAAADGSFVADATLTVKGKRQPINFTFTVTEKGPLRVLKGRARLDRHALGIGTGEWEDRTWVGQFVEVEVQVTAANL